LTRSTGKGTKGRLYSGN